MSFLHWIVFGTTLQEKHNNPSDFKHVYILQVFTERPGIILTTDIWSPPLQFQEEFAITILTDASYPCEI